jgi:hypothetical protein
MKKAMRPQDNIISAYRIREYFIQKSTVQKKNLKGQKLIKRNHSRWLDLFDECRTNGRVSGIDR